MNKIEIILTSLLFLCSCQKEEKTSYSDYPQSKIWAHKCNDTTIAQKKELLFDGLEVDVNYSDYQKELFIGHDLCDTTLGLTLDQWFAALKKNSSNYYWIDMKNISTQNAQEISDKIVLLKKKYNIKHLMLENGNYKALKIVKKNNIPVIYWVENFWYWTKFKNGEWTSKDTLYWYQSVKSKVDDLQPDALSCEYRLFPLLPDSFIDYNIHLWHTKIIDSIPINLTTENEQTTKTLCSHNSVKVVLVDYEHPIQY